MSQFLRLLTEKNKAEALAEICTHLRQGQEDPRNFELQPESFDAVPGKPFAYWVSDRVLRIFRSIPAFECDRGKRVARRGVNSNDDFRFLRCRWEVQNTRWVDHPKGGAFSPFYSDIHLVVDWFLNGAYLEAERKTNRVYAFAIVPSKDLYFRPGLTWPRRTQGGLSFRAMPAGSIFADKGPAAFVADDRPDELLALLAIVNSRAFGLLVSLQMAFGSYEVGVIQKTPVPNLDTRQTAELAALARRAWSLKRDLDTIDETSQAFLLPGALRPRLGNHDPSVIEAELAAVRITIDEIAFDVYGFADADRAAETESVPGDAVDSAEDYTNGEDDTSELPLDMKSSLLSWAAGVSFGRFDWRLASCEREAPRDPSPFDPLPAKSPGMLPDGAEPFHAHVGVLVDDQGHPHDLVRLVEEVLARVEADVPDDVRRWLQREFFVFHLQRYSKSRRRAPIYWPLSTTSGNYTLWIYYPCLTGQTVYTAVNDFVEPRLKQVGDVVTALRNKGAARTRDDERKFEALQAFELELVELRDTLLKLAPAYKPNLDDGVQINAAPLWPLFRHKPWQKLLKDTWAKLEKGDYDWARLAMNYWPARVREKCKADKSLAIAHGLEHLYVEPEAKPKKARGKGETGAGE
jgi:hypothetical protein